MDYDKDEKSSWEWIVIIAVIGLVIYGLVYYLFLAKKPVAQVLVSPTPTITTLITPTEKKTELVMTKMDKTKGDYLTDAKGMTLYTYDKDTANISNCTGTCLTNWPVFVATASIVGEPNLGVMTRSDGVKQYTWKSKPLYYFAKDMKTGDLMGDGVLKVWHIVKP